MKVKKVPMRTCVITHEKLEKRDLLRVVRDNEGNVFVDENMRNNTWKIRKKRFTSCS